VLMVCPCAYPRASGQPALKLEASPERSGGAFFVQAIDSLKPCHWLKAATDSSEISHRLIRACDGVRVRIGRGHPCLPPNELAPLEQSERGFLFKS